MRILNINCFPNIQPSLPKKSDQNSWEMHLYKIIILFNLKVQSLTKDSNYFLQKITHYKFSFHPLNSSSPIPIPTLKPYHHWSKLHIKVCTIELNLLHSTIPSHSHNQHKQQELNSEFFRGNSWKKEVHNKSRRLKFKVAYLCFLNLHYLQISASSKTILCLAGQRIFIPSCLLNFWYHNVACALENQSPKVWWLYSFSAPFNFSFHG